MSGIAHKVIPNISKMNGSFGLNKPHSTQESILELKIRALEKYKTNYELLCSQLGELNGQVGLQLQRHELDVSTFKKTIHALESKNSELEKMFTEKEAQLKAQESLMKQDREYSERVHRQLSTAAELLKATEKRIDTKEKQLIQEKQDLQTKNTHLQAQMELLQEEYNTKFHQENERRLKYKKENEKLKAQVNILNQNLEKERSLYRKMKKQYTKEKKMNQDLVKRLDVFQEDAVHLADIIEGQKKYEYQNQSQLKNYKKENKQLHTKIDLLKKENDKLQNDLVQSREENSTKNLKITLLNEQLSKITIQLEDIQDQQNLINQQQTKLSVVQNTPKSTDMNQTGRSHEELYQMRSLLAQNDERTQESSREVETLKKEFLSVQKLLKEYKKDQIERVLLEEKQQFQRAKMENSILECAIMEQVRKNHPSIQHPTQYSTNKTSSYKIQQQEDDNNCSI